MRNASSLSSMVELAASDPILTSRHLSDDGTARLASWSVIENNYASTICQAKRYILKPSTSKSGRKTAVSNSRSESVPKEMIKQPPRPDAAGMARAPPKPHFDFCTDLSHLRNNLSSLSFAQIPSTPLNSRLRSMKQTASTETQRESSEELGVEFPLLESPRNFLDSMLITIPVLGFRKCGKTSLLNSLVQAGPTRTLTSSSRSPNYYYPIVIFNYQVFNFRLIDCPMMLQDFPLSTLDAWKDFRGWGLHVADFFILVFDITSELSFQYVKLLREQILAANVHVPMVVVANKIDLLKNIGNNSSGGRQSLAASTLSIQLSGRPNHRVFPRNHPESSSSFREILCSPSQSHISILSHNHIPINQKLVFRRDLALLVKKHWKECVLVECSALYNFNTLAILKEVLRLVQYRQCGHKPSTAQSVQAVWQRNQCSIL
ncbi:hypothetical protein Aperf_G00000043334 [Anoplocephala perfoliata]